MLALAGALVQATAVIALALLLGAIVGRRNAALQHSERRAYAQCLVDLAEQSPLFARIQATIGLVRADGSMEARIKGILDGRRQPMTWTNWWVLGVVGLGLLAAGLALAPAAGAAGPAVSSAPASRPAGDGWVAVMANKPFYQEIRRPEIVLRGVVGWQDPGVAGNAGPSGGWLLNTDTRRLFLGVLDFDLKPYLNKTVEVVGKAGDARIPVTANTVEVGWIRLVPDAASGPASRPVPGLPARQTTPPGPPLKGMP
jgi:hypothetical protein